MSTPSDIKIGLTCTALVLIFSFTCSFASPPKETYNSLSQKQIVSLMLKNLKSCIKHKFDGSPEAWNIMPQCRIINT